MCARARLFLRDYLLVPLITRRSTSACVLGYIGCKCLREPLPINFSITGGDKEHFALSAIPNASLSHRKNNVASVSRVHSVLLTLYRRHAVDQWLRKISDRPFYHLYDVALTKLRVYQEKEETRKPFPAREMVGERNA